MENSNEQLAPVPDNTVATEAQDQGLLTPTVEATPETAEKPASSQSDDAPLLNAEEADDKGGAEKPSAESAQAPEVYESFTMPEGFTLTGERLEEATGLFRELNLSQAGAQKLVDYFVKRTIDDKAQGIEALANQRKEWRAQIRNRPDFASERALAKKGIAKVVTDPDERELFNDSWMQDHPAVWKIFVKVGQLVSEDTIPSGGSGGPSDNVNKLRFSVKQ